MMPFRLIFLSLIMVLLVTFIGFNVENRCDISFAFYILEDIPVVLTILASFALGLVAALPFARNSRKRKNDAARPVGKKTGKKGIGGMDAAENVRDERFPSGGIGTP